MYLKSLTLRGFKSFASATTLQFEPGITCVVGPNGSGKSNVVDALAWVMGAQAAKSLRGGKMEDVIFAGTSQRAPLGRAEVALTIDNTDGALPIEYTEVTIARTMFRNGGSEYSINGATARLLDVQELLSDSGIGREMHVIVGQGQLDSILQATPEGRRGFIEEAAGVLKHRRRKEKALRKLESTEGNLHRLNDLIGELRRQLKPLGRQAQVARKAAVIQAEVRDARARLLADDLVMATLELESDAAAEAELRRRRAEVEQELTQARAEETAAEAATAADQPRLTRAQETWYALTGLRERVASTESIAAERLRQLQARPAEERRGPRPEDYEADADRAATTEAELAEAVRHDTAALATAGSHRADAEAAAAAAEKRYSDLVRAIADRREGLARLTGQVDSLRSRAAASVEEIGRLTAARTAAEQRAAQAEQEFVAVETRVAGLDAGEGYLDVAHEEAEAALEEANRAARDLRTTEQQAGSARAAAAARVDALRLGLDRKDASAALLAAGGDGLLGSVSDLLRVDPGYETAVAAALGQAAEAVVVTDVGTALAAFDRLRSEDLGRATLLVGGGPVAPGAPAGLPAYASAVADRVTAPADLAPAVRRALQDMVVVADLAAARDLIAERPDLIAVTRDGDLLSGWYATGGAAKAQSLLELTAMVHEAEQALTDATAELERLRFAAEGIRDRQAVAKEQVAATLARLHESDAAMEAVAEELGRLAATARSARGEADRLGTAIGAAETARDKHAAGLAELTARLERASAEGDPDETADPTERNRLAEAARQARAAETDAKLALRTTEERARSVAGKADQLRRAAAAERLARTQAAERREQQRREAGVATAVRDAARWLLGRVEASADLAGAERAAAEAARAGAEQRLTAARQRVRALSEELQQLTDSVHRDELARTGQRMRVEALQAKALEELGLAPEILTDEFGPDVPVPVLVARDGTRYAEDEAPEPVPFVRAEQEKRLRRAEKDLKVLGRVNPLALEEFDAMTERHAFLAEQLEDLRRTRKDLADIITEVDNRVEQVFAEAYADVEKAFAGVFATLFPGGEGRLVLTEPGQWLTTGVDVEARPPGKKVKRLSLLSGGERSLVAVAFLVSLFIARPSPFYILDEVEAALDDVNLGRLLEIYEQLRENSQLLVITHQKRTMEIADALYGVTMRGDGVSTVISQRMHE
ncbi:chromosome segregation protein SMC [Granulicoccus phenolivorans]|uniref:chromosome segregation protein SMC n=1 Tax=Granulicoccus phenolivorans TaxID=266854 RepID=UPI0003F8F477|nr:chromosome segregation protein SMC [Granulicoccus phenolivorans]